jgi:hypothetical protein
MANLKQAVRLADLAFVYDAAEVEQGAHLLVALCEKEQTTLLASKLPRWAAMLLATE